MVLVAEILCDMVKEIGGFHMTDIVILGGARTAIGGFGGALAGTTPIALGTIVAKAAIERSGISADQIGQVAYGHVINTEPKDMYVSRVAAMDAGIPDTVPAMNVNRLCGSGAQAIVSMVQSLVMGDAEFALAGGTENMSRSPFIISDQRWGAKMGDIQTRDMMLGALNCPFGTGHMGVTAENVAAEHGISREDQDAFALESQTHAAAAVEAGYFTDQIVPVPVRVRRDTVDFVTDEHPKATTAAQLASLRPAFQKDGTVTAGNASGLNDGAAAIVMATADAAATAGLTPAFRILGYAHAGVRPEVMGIGPVPAVEKLLAKTGLKAQDFDVIESNEAFAAQAIAVNRALGLDPAKVNPNGGAIALGHPVGATGAIITIKAMYELERTQTKRALITMCIGGGQGIALAIERL
ncbi:MAG: acetyl-CoA C-acetyltransferase [Yoonia sp.]